MKYDALLWVSFGGPEGMDDVMPYLENVLRGKNVPRERMEEVVHHYELFNGVSPINAQNREMIAAVEESFRAAGTDLPVYFGNRNWHPLLPDTLRRMTEDGVRHALAFVTSAYSCYSGCRQYREDIARARAEVGDAAPGVDKIRVFYNHPEFIAANADRLTEARDRLPVNLRAGAPVIFTAHSIPFSMARGCDYEAQLRETCRLVAEAAGCGHWQLAYQSRSGPPHQPWLEPDVNDVLRALRDEGAGAAVVAPVGFLSDHIEVLFDLDEEARETAEQIGLVMERAATVGTHPRFAGMVRELVEERLSGKPERRTLGNRGPKEDVCPENCCLRGEGLSRPARS